ncbi:MAG: response regulator transcription factor [Acidobacteriota bacterium]|nr:response regulator transcription factor [Acidobacteriota bacterium]
MRLLVVEDEKSLARHLMRGLREESYSVDLAGTGAEAQQLVEEAEYDLLILDLMLPDASGLDLLRTWRSEGLATPVLILTARDAVENKVHGLDAGADDYLTKPFAFEELLARVRSLLRRRLPPQSDTLEEWGVVLDRAQHLAWRDGHKLDLTPREFALLEFFLLHPGVVLSRERIAESVWDRGYEARTNVIEVILARLRRKLEAEGGPRLIQTVIGTGYTLRPPDDAAAETAS